MSKITDVGIVGLGLVGKAIAGRLIARGWRVAGFDIDAQAWKDAERLGVDVVGQADLLCEKCKTIFLSLPDSAAVAWALWGEGAIGSKCSPGSTILDTTTARPRDTFAHHVRLAERDVRFIDAPLVGSSREIAEGEAVALVGDREDAADYGELIRAFAREIFFLREPGQAHRAKLVVNLVLGLNRLVLAEGLALAERVGIDLHEFLKILKDSAAYSRVMDTKGPKMAARDFSPAARLAQHAKDVGLILELAQEMGGRTPLSQLHATLLQEAVASGWGALDNAAIFNVFAPPT